MKKILIAGIVGLVIGYAFAHRPTAVKFGDYMDRVTTYDPKDLLFGAE